MQFQSYWHDNAPAFDAAQCPVEGHYDVAVGGGFTGLLRRASWPRPAETF